MMAMPYPQSNYGLFGSSQWPNDVKTGFADDHDSNMLGDKVLDSSPSSDLTPPDQSQSSSMIKVEENFSGTGQMWHDRPHSQMMQMRHYSHPSVPIISPGAHNIARVDSGYGPAFAPHQHPPQPWSMAAHSENNTPTPVYTTVPDHFNQPIQYPAGPVNYRPFQHPDPAAAVSMSPQSSQGGWASTTSSENAEIRHPPRSPRYRPTSPMTVIRSDGIRKKNARFEIPKERNLANIDALIMQSTDEAEKKELKQQKRLLRNRQAALDSRQRKKTHTEKLEQEKKLFTTQKGELQETVAALENTLAHERDQWLQQRQQFEHLFQSLQYERDEAIRTKTLETAELRRQNNILKNLVRDLERPQIASAFLPHESESLSGEFGNFSTLGLDDNWETEFSLIGSEDLKMDDHDSPRREATPRPLTSSTQASAPKPVSVKTDSGFSWNTFCMCLLVGAFMASQSNKDATASSSTTTNLPTTMPTLSEDYRAEAGNVLKAVLASAPESSQDLLPTRSAVGTGIMPTTITGSEFSRMTQQAPSSSLEVLHTTLTTPTRHQQAAAAFSLSSSSYSHVTNPEGILDDDDEDEVVQVKPSRLQELFANMQAERDGLERISGLGSKARERSVLLDRVPEKVLRDFRGLVGLNEQMQRMQQE